MRSFSRARRALRRTLDLLDLDRRGSVERRLFALCPMLVLPVSVLAFFLKTKSGTDELEFDPSIPEGLYRFRTVQVVGTALFLGFLGLMFAMAFAIEYLSLRPIGPSRKATLKLWLLCRMRRISWSFSRLERTQALLRSYEVSGLDRHLSGQTSRRVMRRTVLAMHNRQLLATWFSDRLTHDKVHARAIRILRKRHRRFADASFATEKVIFPVGGDFPDLVVRVLVDRATVSTGSGIRSSVHLVTTDRWVWLGLQAEHDASAVFVPDRMYVFVVGDSVALDGADAQTVATLWDPWGDSPYSNLSEAVSAASLL